MHLGITRINPLSQMHWVTCDKMWTGMNRRTKKTRSLINWGGDNTISSCFLRGILRGEWWKRSFHKYLHSKNLGLFFHRVQLSLGRKQKGMKSQFSPYSQEESFYAVQWRRKFIHLVLCPFYPIFQQKYYESCNLQTHSKCDEDFDS